MPKNNKIIIVSYTFPPSPGIGGRRWVKFAKQLNKKGIALRIISASLSRNKDSEWKKDLKGLEGFVSYLNPGIVDYLAKVPQSLFEKLRYKLTLICIKIYSKGNFYDRSLFWAKEVINSLRHELNTGTVECVIATGSPFKYLYDIALLKQEYPNIKFIADLRDPWTVTESYGWNRLVTHRQKKESEYEHFVIDNFDLITTVTPGIINILKERYPGVQKISLVENGYDLDDLKVQQNLGPNQKIIRMIFAGTFYPGASNYLKLFVSGLKKHLAARANNVISIEVDFYGKTDGLFESIIREIDCIKYHGSIPLKEVYEKMQLADYGLLFLSNEIDYSISTKFCEYILYNKPIVVFGPDGYTGSFVKTKQLGWAVHDEKSWIVLLNELEQMKLKKELKLISKESISHLNVSHIADRLLKVISQLKVSKPS